MGKRIVLMSMILICVFQTMVKAQIYPIVTPATEAEAAKVPLSKLQGTWYSDDSNHAQLIIKSNGMAYLSTKASQKHRVDGREYSLTGIMKLKKEGNKILITHSETETRVGNRKVYAYLDDWGSLSIGLQLGALANCVQGFIQYFDKNFMVINGYCWIKKDYYSILTRKKQEMYEAWDKTVNDGTIMAYEHFLSKYPDSEKKAEAEEKINTLKKEEERKKRLEEWNEIKSGNDITLFESFIANYPDAPEIEEAKIKVIALKGSKLMASDDLEGAIEMFKKINKPNLIPACTESDYKTARQYIDFETLSPQSRRESLFIYLNNHPNSPMKDDVQNYIALNLANNFTVYSDQNDYEKALSYATGKTVDIINRKIEQNEAAIKNYQEEQKRLSRKKNGGWVGLKLELLNVSWNCRGDNGLVNYNFGIKFRIGNFNDRVQGAIGFMPGFGAWDFNKIYNDLKKNEKRHPSFFFQMPLEAELRVNLAKVGKDSWFFIDGRYNYNLVRNKMVLTPMGFQAGVGFASVATEILFFYGRQIGKIDSEYNKINKLNNPFSLDNNNNFIGVSFAVDIRL